MPKVYLTNSFSVNMLPDENEVRALLDAGKVKFRLATVFDVHRPNA